MFGGGQQPNTPFGGGGGGFGQQQQTNTAPVFGAPTTTGGGIFGSTPAAPVFGAPASTFGGFGAPAPAPSTTFGAPTTVFGAPPPAPGGGLFGAAATPAPAPFGSTPAPSTTSLFGAAPTPAFGAQAFGAPAPGGLFRAPAPSTSPFAAPQPAPATFGGFGSTSTAPAPTFGAPAPVTGGSLFGTTQAPAPFGAPAPAFGAPTGGGGLFGATPAPAFGASAPASGAFFGSPAPATSPGGGTRGVPYQVTNRQDGTVSINLHAISAMPQYEDKAAEELRHEDYLLGNKGSSTPTASNTSTFGFGAPAPAPTGGLFGQTPAPATGFGGGLFGQPAPAPTFGAPAPSTGGIFGGTPASAPFGAPAPAFGAPAPATGSLFGSSAPAPAPWSSAPSQAPAFGVFGSTPTPAPAFGSAPAPATGSLFSPAPAPFGSAPAPSGGIFGSTQAPAPFGSTPAPAFGGFGTTPTPAPAFGAPAPGGLFGQQPAPAPAFGAAPATGGLFGQPAPAAVGFGGFGAAPAPFGSPAPAPFGAPTPQTTPAPPQAQFLFPPNAQIIAPAAKELLEQRLRAMDNERRELEKLEVWRGGSPGKSPGSTPTSLHEPDAFFSPGSRSTLLPYTPRSGAKIRPRGFPKTEPPKTSALPASTTRRDNSSLMSPEGHVRSSQLNLIIRPDSLKKSRKFGLKLDGPEAGLHFPAETIDRLPTDNGDKATPTHEDDSVPTTHPSPLPRGETQQTQDRTASVSSTIAEPATSPGYEYYQKVIGSTDEEPSQSRTLTAASESHAASPSVIPKLTKKGYEVSPNVEEMSTMSEADLACVKNFSVKRPGYGMVEWEGSVDVRGADLDRIVVIEKQDVSVYTQDEEEGTKPDEGSKLNRPAKITFFGVFPKNGGAQASEEEKKRFADKVRRITQKIGAEFITYESVTGVWKIRVHHFSRYGLLDDDSDEENALEPDAKATEVSTPRQFKPLATRKATPYRPSRITFQDVEMSDVADDEFDTHFTGKEIRDIVRIEAEEAAKEIFEMQNDESETRKRQQSVVNYDFTYSDEGEEDDVSSDDHISEVGEDPTANDLFQASSGTSIRDRLVDARASQVDRGLCMGRSFRVGWLPDGSFLKIGAAPLSESASLVKARPVLSNGFTTTLSLLETQRRHSLRRASGLDDCPLYSLPRNIENTESSFLRNEAVSDALKNFALFECPFADARNVFVLVSNLLNGDDDCNKRDHDFPLGARRLAAVYRLLMDLCGPDTGKDTISQTKALAGVFTALSTGNIEGACERAADAGFMHLSVVLATSAEGRKDIMRLLLQVAESGDLLGLASADAARILENIAGDSKTENSLFRGGDSSLDWRRRLVMQVLQDADKTLPETLQRYESNIASGDVPFPHPAYLLGSSSQTKSLFYRLLQFCADTTSVSLRETVDPSGFTPFLHDFQLPFHLVSAITSVARSSDSSLTLSPFDYAEYIVDGYVTQLTLLGYWDWAVFVSLCIIGSESLELNQSKTKRAKELIIRHYSESDRLRRDFLERQIGIPSKWFEEALCYRAAGSGNALKCCDHAHAFDAYLAFNSFAEVILPFLFFSNKAVCKSWLAEAAPTAPDDSLSRAMHDFFCLEDRLMGASHAEELSVLELGDLRRDQKELLEWFSSSFDDFMRKRPTSSRLSSSLLVPASEKNVSLSSMVSEVLLRLKFLKVQLDCLASRVSEESFDSLPIAEETLG